MDHSIDTPFATTTITAVEEEEEEEEINASFENLWAIIDVMLRVRFLVYTVNDVLVTENEDSFENDIGNKFMECLNENWYTNARNYCKDVFEEVINISSENTSIPNHVLNEFLPRSNIGDRDFYEQMCKENILLQEYLLINECLKTSPTKREGIILFFFGRYLYFLELGFIKYKQYLSSLFISNDKTSTVFDNIKIYDIIAAIASILDGENSQKIMFTIVGPSNSGKSDFQHFLRRIFNEYATTIDFESICKKTNVRIGTGQLKNNPEPISLHLADCRLANVAEISSDGHFHGQLIKTMTSGYDSMTARKLHSNQVLQIRYQFKIVAVGNSHPVIPPDDLAFLGRLYTLTTKNCFNKENKFHCQGPGQIKNNNPSDFIKNVRLMYQPTTEIMAQILPFTFSLVRFCDALLKECGAINSLKNTNLYINRLFVSHYLDKLWVETKYGGIISKLKYCPGILKMVSGEEDFFSLFCDSGKKEVTETIRKDIMHRIPGLTDADLRIHFNIGSTNSALGDSASSGSGGIGREKASKQRDIGNIIQLLVELTGTTLPLDSFWKRYKKIPLIVHHENFQISLSQFAKFNDDEGNKFNLMFVKIPRQARYST
jgi:hypothetical protein